MAETKTEKKAVSGDKPPPPDPYANRDEQVFQELTQDIGQWSGATGIAGPGAAQLAAWQQQYGTSLSGQLQEEAANIGWYASRDHNLPTTTNAAILAAAQKDPRWAGLDANGRAALEQMYNLQQMGYQGNLGANTPLAPLTPGPSGTTGIGAPTAGGLTSTQQDAWAQLQQTLQEYGFSGQSLAALVAWAKQEIIKGNSASQIALDLQQTPQFKARFPAIGVLSGEGVAITPAEYISMEQSYASLEHQAGLPANFASYDALIANQVSPTEYQARLQQGYLAVSSADPTVVKAMQDFYGVTKGQLAAYFLNPKQQEPLLLQQALSAQIGGASAQSGFRAPGQSQTAEGISADQALRLAKMNVSYAQAQQGFQNLSKESQLYNPLPGGGQVGNQLSGDQLLNAQFGSDGQTALQLALQADYEKGTTNEGTALGKTQEGASGAGAIQR